VIRSDHSKVPPIQRCYFSQFQPFSNRNHRRICSAERQTGVRLDKLSHAVEVSVRDRDQGEDLVADRAEEGSRDGGAALTFQQVADLGQDRAGSSNGRGAVSNHSTQRA
jgi:hypothetical protein